MRFTLLVGGSGGQGGMSMGMTLAESAVKGGKHASFMPLYGPEQRGGAAKCTVIISDEPIISPLPLKTDGLIAMNEASYKKYIKELRPGGLLVRNSSRSTSAIKRDDIRVLEIPADDIAVELGSSKIAGIVLIGAMLGFSNMMDPKMLMDSLEEKFESKGDAIVDLNRRALYKGVELGTKAAAG
ncbi:MAG: hypothetical protein GX684_06440 [Ruminococcaceae bacterium]|nr:hypothetical protein [Oscillospiraceae bacterium]